MSIKKGEQKMNLKRFFIGMAVIVLLFVSWPVANVAAKTGDMSPKAAKFAANSDCPSGYVCGWGVYSYGGSIWWKHAQWPTNGCENIGTYNDVIRSVRNNTDYSVILYENSSCSSKRVSMSPHTSIPQIGWGLSSVCIYIPTWTSCP